MGSGLVKAVIFVVPLYTPVDSLNALGLVLALGATVIEMPALTVVVEPGLDPELEVEPALELEVEPEPG